MDSITITLEDLTASANEIKSVNSNMQNTVSDMNSVIKEVTEYWQSEASDTFNAKFISFMRVFDDCKQAIDNYAKFLDDTVAAYQAADAAINNAANQ